MGGNGKHKGSLGESASSSPEGGEKPKGVALWVKLFVAVHLAAVTVWAVPYAPSSYANGTKWKLATDSVPDFAQSVNFGIRVFNQTYCKSSPLQYYVLTTGFWQYWDMFSPNPSSTDWYGDAVIVYKDGSKKVYQYPRMYKLGIFEKYVKERYRKFFERAHDDNFQYVWPNFALYIARLMDTDDNNPPVEVQLRVYWLEVSPPGKPQPTQYSSKTYYTYEVPQDQLKPS